MLSLSEEFIRNLRKKAKSYINIIVLVNTRSTIISSQHNFFKTTNQTSENVMLTEADITHTLNIVVKVFLLKALLLITECKLFRKN